MIKFILKLLAVILWILAASTWCMLVPHIEITENPMDYMVWCVWAFISAGILTEIFKWIATNVTDPFLDYIAGLIFKIKS